jgi:hypothetical protein
LRFERVDNLGAYRIPPQTGILIPSVNSNYRSRTLYDVHDADELRRSPRAET